VRNSERRVFLLNHTVMDCCVHTLLCMLTVYVGCCCCSKIGRLDRRVDILEDKVNYNSDVFKEDIGKLFSLLNDTVLDKQCDDTMPTTPEHGHEPDQRLSLSVQRAFNQEKTLLRTMGTQMKQNWTRMKCDLASDLTDIQSAADNSKLNMETFLQGVGDELKNMQQYNDKTSGEIITNVSQMIVQTHEKLQSLHNGQTQTVTYLGSFDTIQRQLNNRIRDLEQQQTHILSKLNDFNRSLEQFKHDIMSEVQGFASSMNSKLKTIDDKQIRIYNQLNNVSSSNQYNDLVAVMLIANGWRKYGSSFYHFYQEKVVTWSTAKDYCKSLNARMVEINTDGENDFVTSQAKDVLKKDIWTGVRKNGQSWMWDSGSNVAFGNSNWAPGEPSNDRNEVCVELWARSSYRWNNVVCSDKKAVICEKNV